MYIINDTQEKVIKLLSSKNHYCINFYKREIIWCNRDKCNGESKKK
jgi:hypothetical protein